MRLLIVGGAAAGLLVGAAAWSFRSPSSKSSDIGGGEVSSELLGASALPGEQRPSIEGQLGSGEQPGNSEPPSVSGDGEGSQAEPAVDVGDSEAVQGRRVPLKDAPLDADANGTVEIVQSLRRGTLVRRYLKRFVDRNGPEALRDVLRAWRQAMSEESSSEFPGVSVGLALLEWRLGNETEAVAAIKGALLFHARKGERGPTLLREIAEGPSVFPWSAEDRASVGNPGIHRQSGMFMNWSARVGAVDHAQLARFQAWLLEVSRTERWDAASRLACDVLAHAMWAHGRFGPQEATRAMLQVHAECELEDGVEASGHALTIKEFKSNLARYVAKGDASALLLDRAASMAKESADGWASTVLVEWSLREGREVDAQSDPGVEWGELHRLVERTTSSTWGQLASE